jgi:hypothetical protein
MTFPSWEVRGARLRVVRHGVPTCPLPGSSGPGSRGDQKTKPRKGRHSLRPRLIENITLIKVNFMLLRLDLARAIAERDDPLTARRCQLSMDASFRRGTRQHARRSWREINPTHPELLNWLVARSALTTVDWLLPSHRPLPCPSRLSGASPLTVSPLRERDAAESAPEESCAYSRCRTP